MPAFAFTLDMVQTLALAAVILFVGYGVRRRVGVLNRYNIPAPVIGGFLFAAVALALRLRGLVTFEFDTALQTPLMIAFFTTIGLGASLALLKVGGPQAYDFVWDSKAIRGKLAGLSLIPFAGYHRGADLNSLDQLLLKLWLSMPVGFLSWFLAPGPAPTRRLWVAGWLAAVGLLFAVIEAGQLLLPSRFPDPSDILAAVAGAAVGLAATFWLLEPPS